MINHVIKLPLHYASGGVDCGLSQGAAGLLPVRGTGSHGMRRRQDFPSQRFYPPLAGLTSASAGLPGTGRFLHFCNAEVVVKDLAPWRASALCSSCMQVLTGGPAGPGVSCSPSPAPAAGEAIGSRSILEPGHGLGNGPTAGRDMLCWQRGLQGARVLPASATPQLPVAFFIPGGVSHLQGFALVIWPCCHLLVARGSLPLMLGVSLAGMML